MEFHFLRMQSSLLLRMQRLFLSHILKKGNFEFQKYKIMSLRNLVAILLVLVLFSCKEEQKVQTTDDVSSFQSAMEKLQTEPGKASAQNFILEVRKKLASETSQDAKLDLLLKGLNVAEEYKMGPTAIGFLMPLVKEYSTIPQFEEHFAKLASALNDIGKTIPGGILVQAYETNFPSGKYLDKLKAKQKEDISDMNQYITTLAENVFVEPDKFGINRVSAQKYVDACEAFAIGFPQDTMAAEYLYRAAEMARTIKTYPKALSIFDWIEEKYPNFEKTPTTVFLKGFMLENELNNKEAAREIYNRFLENYPKDDLADDVKFLLENIDKSDEEIMKMIDQKSNQ
ncbi:MAG: hypothetical protein P1U56_25755 [Saprospiraceae bacterium]|nr:hypothetical protein [Saprospiraceae bacterium]